MTDKIQQIQLRGDKEDFEYLLNTEDFGEALSMIKNLDEMKKFTMASGIAPGYNIYDNRSKVHIYNITGYEDYIVQYQNTNLLDYVTVSEENLTSKSFIKSISDFINVNLKHAMDNQNNEFKESFEVVEDELEISQKVVSKLKNNL